MPDKTNPIGICDYCGEAILDSWYTTAGTPRLYCCDHCKGKGISRVTRFAISRKAKERVANGTWVNPAVVNPPSPVRIGEGVRRAALRKVAEDEAADPALAHAARRVLAIRQRKDATLRRALDKVERRVPTADLTPAELDAYAAYRAELDTARREYHLTWKRAWYQAQRAALTDDEREAQRARWREATQRKRVKGDSVGT